MSHDCAHTHNMYPYTHACTERYRENWRTKSIFANTLLQSLWVCISQHWELKHFLGSSCFLPFWLRPTMLHLIRALHVQGIHVWPSPNMLPIQAVFSQPIPPSFCYLGTTASIQRWGSLTFYTWKFLQTLPFTRVCFVRTRWVLNGQWLEHSTSVDYTLLVAHWTHSHL